MWEGSESPFPFLFYKHYFYYINTTSVLRRDWALGILSVRQLGTLIPKWALNP